MSPPDDVQEAVERIAAAETWDERVALIRMIPEHFGKALHQRIYADVANAAYVPHLAPDFAYVHWRDEYELEAVERAFEHAQSLTRGFTEVDAVSLAAAIHKAPTTLRIFRLLLGLTTQEFAASTAIVAAMMPPARPLTNSAVKGMESGRACAREAAGMAAAVIAQAMSGTLFHGPKGDVRSKLSKPDTIGGWDTVRRFAADGVPLPVLLHQRHYGGAFRQLLDATSGRRGDLLEDVVEELFVAEGVPFVRTGPSTQEKIAKEFGLTIRPAPDFVVHDSAGTVRAILECKQANDGGTARDKAARFRALKGEAVRIGGVPVFAVLAGLGWRRTADALGPVVRDTDGRVFTVQTLEQMITVEPFPYLRRREISN